MTRLGRLVLFCCLICALGAEAQVTTAAAGDNQVPLKNLSLEQLSQIEVTTTSKEPVPTNRVAAATYVITSEDIRRSGVTSIADALRLAPGVEVSRISSDYWAISIRGLQSNFSQYVLVLIDGRSVYTPLFAGVYWDVQDMPLEDIDRIEVVRGPGATIWGPNAVNGVVNIITKSSADTKGAMVETVDGTQDRTMDTVQYGGSIGKTGSYRAYARGFLREPEYHANGLDFDQWHQERGGFRMDWTPQKNSFLLEGDVYGGVSPHEVGTTTVLDDAVSGGDVLGRWRHQFSERSDFYLQAYFDRTLRISSLYGETRDTIDIDFLHHIKIGDHNDVSWGGEARWSPNLFIGLPGFIGILPPADTDYIYSGFVQDELDFFRNRLAVTLGSKLEDTNYGGFDAQPSLRVLWAPNEKQSYWASVSRAVATPSRLEEDYLLQGITPAFTIQVTGNAHFRNQFMMGYEAGFRELLTKKVYVDIAAFHNNYTNLQSFGAEQITPPPPTLVISIPYTNQIGGWTNGVEVAPSWQVTPWWRLTGSYSYVGIDMHANGATSDISSTGSVATYEGSTPHHMIEIQSEINLPKKFEFDQFYRYASSLPAQKVAAYQTMDARLGYKIRSRLEISVEGQNLFQPWHYEWGTGDPSQQLIGIKRAGYVKLVWTR